MGCEMSFDDFELLVGILVVLAVAILGVLLFFDAQARLWPLDGLAVVGVSFLAFFALSFFGYGLFTDWVEQRRWRKSHDV